MGTQSFQALSRLWIPACVGMTDFYEIIILTNFIFKFKRLCSLTVGKIKTAPALHIVSEKYEIRIALPDRYKPESNYFSVIESTGIESVDMVD